MILTNLIKFIKTLQNVELLSSGLKGSFIYSTTSDINLISEFEDSEIRDLHYKNNNTAYQTKLVAGEEVVIIIALCKFN